MVYSPSDLHGISRVNPLITGVITHLLSGMNHQVGPTYGMPILPRNRERPLKSRGGSSPFMGYSSMSLDWTMFCIPMQIHRQSSVRPVTAYMFKQSDFKQLNRYIFHTSRNFAQGRLVSLCQFTLTVGEHSEVCFKITIFPSFFAGTSPSNTSVDSKNIIPSCLFSTQKIFASCSIYFFGFYKNYRKSPCYEWENPQFYGQVQ